MQPSKFKQNGSKNQMQPHRTDQKRIIQDQTEQIKKKDKAILILEEEVKPGSLWTKKEI